MQHVMTQTSLVNMLVGILKNDLCDFIHRANLRDVLANCIELIFIFYICRFLCGADRQSSSYEAEARQHGRQEP